LVGLTGALLLGECREGDSGDPCLLTFGRTDAEARFHPLLGRWGDVWMSGMAGLAWFGQPNPFGAHAGVGAGADFMPVPGLSLGIHLRTGLVAAPDAGSGDAGAWAEASGSLVLGLRALE
jgi:hypothetical protein